MSSADASSAVSRPLRRLGEALRVAFAGPSNWLDGCAPSEPASGLVPARFALEGDAAQQRSTLERLAAYAPHVTVIFDPPSLPDELLSEAMGVTLGVLVGGIPDGARANSLHRLDRLTCFDQSLTGKRAGRASVWRAIPPPVSDQLFSEPRPQHSAPRPVSIGRSTAHRETMLMPAKHHHDLIQVIHGVSGRRLSELLDECDVGVFIAAEEGGGFGLQVGIHLASGQLLLAEELTPKHGLERNIDYVQIDSPDELVWTLNRLGRFPEMHNRIRIRGRLKAEQYRASRLFARVVHDLLRDVAAFGTSARAAQRVAPCRA
jgi:hypothetical protein